MKTGVLGWGNQSERQEKEGGSVLLAKHKHKLGLENKTGNKYRWE